jgi:hypothetical protein
MRLVFPELRRAIRERPGDRGLPVMTVRGVTFVFRRESETAEALRRSTHTRP